LSYQARHDVGGTTGIVAPSCRHCRYREQ